MSCSHPRLCSILVVFLVACTRAPSSSSARSVVHGAEASTTVRAPETRLPRAVLTAMCQNTEGPTGPDATLVLGLDSAGSVVRVRRRAPRSVEDAPAVYFDPAGGSLGAGASGEGDWHDDARAASSRAREARLQAGVATWDEAHPILCGEVTTGH